APTAPLPRVGPAAPRPPGGDPRRDREAGRVSHLPAFLRDPPAGERLRHPDGPGVPRPSRRTNHDDLHPRAEPGGLGIVSPVDVVLGSRLPAERPGVVQIDGEASPPIARSTARMAIDNRRQIEDLSENARAPLVLRGPRNLDARR